MALIDMSVSGDTEVVALRANNAAEMELLVADFLANTNASGVYDIQLVGTGASPNFACLLTVGNAEGAGSPVVDPSNAIAKFFGGLDTVDPIALVADMQTDIGINAGVLYKTQLAGGGVGPHWMACSLYEE